MQHCTAFRTTHHIEECLSVWTYGLFVHRSRIICERRIGCQGSKHRQACVSPDIRQKNEADIRNGRLSVTSPLARAQTEAPKLAGTVWTGIEDRFKVNGVLAFHFRPNGQVVILNERNKDGKNELELGQN